jgi:predicted DNA-binding transcriptional regulator AlpA
MEEQKNRTYAPDFVSASTLAYRLDCSRATIDSCVKAGYLPGPARIGNLVRWDFMLVRAHIAQMNVGAVIQEDDFMKAFGDGKAEEA